MLLIYLKKFNANILLLVHRRKKPTDARFKNGVEQL